MFLEISDRNLLFQGALDWGSESGSEGGLFEGDSIAIAFGSVECRFQEQAAAQSSETPTPLPAPTIPQENEARVEPHASFGSQLVGLGKAAFGEAKRGSHSAALKTSIEKLKPIDLNKAHYALGRKCYNLGLHALVNGTTKSYRNGFTGISKIFLGSVAHARFTKS